MHVRVPAGADPYSPAVASVPSARFASLSRGQRLLAVLFVVAGIGYLAWRPGHFNADAPAFSALVYAAELFGFVAGLLHLFVCWRLQRRAALPVPGDATVAVLVPTTVESADVVRRTVAASMKMRHVGEVWLLDDGNRLEMHVLAEELGCHYLARKDAADGQAGSLNHALRHTRAEYVAVFDAGHSPAPTFLAETLGFFRDQHVAFVQTPLDFYNLDAFPYRFDRRESRVWSEQTLLFRVVQAGLDRRGSTQFCGSCAVIRRAALEDIGGFATGTAAHDLQTSLRFHRHGWRSVYYARSLAFGRAPSSAGAFLEQRRRRGQDAWRVWRQEGLVRASGLSAPQRISYAALMLGGVGSWQRAVLYFTPAIALITGVLPVSPLDREFLLIFVPYVLLALWSFAEAGRGYDRRMLAEQYAMLSFAATLGALGDRLLRKLRMQRSQPGAEPSTTADTVRSKLWPVRAVLSLNAVAIPTGLLLYGQGRGLPSGPLAGAVLCSSLLIGIAALALHHAKRNATFKRREYRFPLPVPLRVPTSKSEDLALATDISPDGCRIVGAMVGRARIGDLLHAELLLPTGPLPVQATVMAVIADPARGDAPGALGCQFRWGLSDERSQLEMLLFGSDLQWRLNGIEDRIRTPIEWLADRVRGVHPDARRLRGLRWSPLLYRRINAQLDASVGFISVADRDDGVRIVASLVALPEQGRMYAEELTAAGTRGIVGRLVDEQVLETHAAPIYLYRLSA